MFCLRFLRKRRNFLRMGNAGSTIKVMRKAQNLSQRELGRLAGVNSGYLSRVEAGHEVPTARWLKAVTDALGKHLADGGVA